MRSSTVSPPSTSSLILPPACRRYRLRTPPRDGAARRGRAREPEISGLGISVGSPVALPGGEVIYSAEYQQLCRLLRELRQEAGLTQVQVAERLGVPQSFVSKYETAERRLDIIELGHLGRVIGFSI
ncbi:helix-turn-helix domain-containing protein [Amycolatopsis tucumanensis]|uniref:helix-turn-helix domain-containing protein n=1 Tax=Amycolatopsis tucumanensis TaxID=401106 RepID=UPI003D75E267